MSLQSDTARLVSMRLLPTIFLALIMLQLDRTNVGFAALQMNSALGFSAEVFGFGAGIFFIGYAIFEIPSNFILRHVGAPIWIGRIAVTWGLVCCAMAFVQGPVSFYILRFLLGIAEAGFLPGVVYYLSMWYTNEQRAGGLGILFTASAAAGLIGGLLAGVLLKIDAFSLSGWQWLFLIEGGATVVVGIFFALTMPKSLADAQWLPAANRDWLEQTIERENAEKAKKIESHSFVASLKSSAVWIFSLAYFFLSVGFYSLFFWIPQVIKNGFPTLSNSEIAWVSAVPYVCGIVGLIVVSKYSDRSGNRGWHLGALGIVAGIGLIIGTQSQPIVGFLSLCLGVTAAWAYLAVFWPAPMNLLGGTAAVGGLALINSLGNLGGFVGPYVVGIARDMTGTFNAGIIAFAACLMLSGVIPLAFSALFNRRTTSSPHAGAVDPMTSRELGALEK
jgi:MFS family permease